MRNYTSLPTLTSLSAAATNSATQVTVASVTNLPVAPFLIVFERGTVNEEVALCTAVTVSTKTLTVTRGYDGTIAVAHANATSVEHTTSAVDYADPQNHIAASSGVHGLTGAVVGTSDTQTLTGKSIDGGSNTLTNVPKSALPSDTYYSNTALSATTGSFSGALSSSADTQFNGRSLPRGVPGSSWMSKWTTSTALNATTTAVNTGLAVTVTLVSGRRYKVCFDGMATSSVSGDRFTLQMNDSVSGIIKTSQSYAVGTANSGHSLPFSRVLDCPGDLSAASHTINLQMFRYSGTGNIDLIAAAGTPAQLWVEDLGPNT